MDERRFSLAPFLEKGGMHSMDIKKRDFLSLAAGVGAAAGLAATTGKAEGQGRRPSPTAVPYRLAIVVWPQQCPALDGGLELQAAPHQQGDRALGRRPAIYYNGSGLDQAWTLCPGRQDGAHWYDAINVEMEHGALDFTQLREFIARPCRWRPTRSGHRTPAVFVEPALLHWTKPMPAPTAG